MIGQYVTVHGDVISHVNISQVMVEDGGEYSCTAENRAGKVTHAARLNVYGNPLFFHPNFINNLQLIHSDEQYCENVCYQFKNKYYEYKKKRLLENKMHESKKVKWTYIYVCLKNSAAQIYVNTISRNTFTKFILFDFHKYIILFFQHFRLI